MEQDPAGSHDVLQDHNAIVLFTGNRDGPVWKIGPISKSGNSGGHSGKLSIMLTCLLETVPAYHTSGLRGSVGARYSLE